MHSAGGPAETTAELYGHNRYIEALSRPDLEVARHGLWGYKRYVLCCFVSRFHISSVFDRCGTYQTMCHSAQKRTYENERLSNIACTQFVDLQAVSPNLEVWPGERFDVAVATCCVRRALP